MVTDIRQDGSAIDNPSQGAVAPRLSVLVLDDRAFFRECLVAAIQAAKPEICVHATFLDPRRRTLPGHAFAVILLDAGGQESGDEIASKVAQARVAGPDAAVVVTCDHPSRVSRVTSGAGTPTIVATSGTDLDTLIGIIEQAAVRPRHAEPASASTVTPVTDPCSRPSPAGNLTDREVTILKKISEGKSNWIITCELGLQEITTKLHIRYLMRKMGVTKRSELESQARAVFPTESGSSEHSSATKGR